MDIEQNKLYNYLNPYWLYIDTKFIYYIILCMLCVYNNTLLK